VKRKHMLSSLAVALVSAVAMAVVPMAQAQNADPNAKAVFIGKIKSSGATATLKVRYRCNAGEALWVSAKQTKSGKKSPALKKEGSSEAAHSWLQSHRNPFTCDSTFHKGTFTIDKVEPGSKGKLKKGKAWVQFCVTQGQETLVLSKSAWVGVKKKKA
jgi:hypothetical protein